MRSNSYSSLALLFALSSPFFVVGGFFCSFVGWVFLFVLSGVRERGMFSIIKTLHLHGSCLAFLKSVKMKTDIFKYCFQSMF